MMFVTHTKDQYILFVGHIDADIIDAIPMVTFRIIDIYLSTDGEGI
jgi:hypothetical protein